MADRRKRRQGDVVALDLQAGLAPNGGWEYPAFWAVALIVQALVGDGALALLPTPVRS